MTRKISRPVLVVLVAATAVNLLAGVVYGLRRPMCSDASYFLGIAKSLADGHGYFLKEGFWPDQPTMSRAPAWPFLVSAGLRACRSVSPDLLMRIMSLALNAVVAALVAALALRLFRTAAAALIAGLAWAVYPMALFEACEGNSEILFLGLALTGVLLILERSGTEAPDGGPALPAIQPASSARFLAGCLTLGCACLVRTNFVLFGVFALVTLGVCCRFRFSVRAARLLAMGLLLFSLPSGLWALRNYRVCGDFPVLSTLRGQTLYGGNNPVVAETLPYWGYWVFPDVIPGEKTMYELSRTMSEYDVDCYYTRKARAFIRGHKLAMPRLLLGKLIRAYVPIPWKPSLGSYAVSAVRWVLYATALAGLIVAWRRVDRTYRAILAAVMLTNVTTVLLFYGYSRFAFELDPFLLPLSAFALMVMFRRRDFKDA